MTIGENIKNLRLRYGLTQKELGDIVGKSAIAISTWENDIKQPRMGSIQKMADYFGILKSDIIEPDKLCSNIFEEKDIPLSKIEKVFIEDFRTLDSVKKQTLLNLMAFFKHQVTTQNVSSVVQTNTHGNNFYTNGNSTYNLDS